MSSPLPGLAVLGTFLAIGLTLWFLILKPSAESGRLPLAKQQGGEVPQGAPAGSKASLPQDHPPLEIPKEVKTYLTDLEKKANDSPSDIEAWRTLAQVQYRAGQFERRYLEKAEASYNHVLGIDAKDLDALRNIGNIYFDREEYGDAVKSYIHYLELKPDDSNVRTDLGTMYLYSGDNDKAVREYQKVIEREPAFFQAHFNLGIALAKKGDQAKAVEALEKAKSLAPDEKTRSQVQALIDRTTGAPAADGSRSATTFQGRVEQSIRNHEIAGPKVVKFEWPSPTTGRVVLDNFPFEAMPEFARTKFLDHLKGNLSEARKQTNTTEAVRLDLVDRASGNVMASVTAD